MKIIILLFILSCPYIGADEDVTGLWHIRRSASSPIRSTIFVYEHESRVYGRIVVTYVDGQVQDHYLNPRVRSEALVDEPYYAGLDMIWGLEHIDHKWKKGTILDPQKGRLYSAEMWRRGDNLNVRGKIGPIGVNQIWYPVCDEDLPEGFIIPQADTLIPQIPLIK